MKSQVVVNWKCNKIIAEALDWLHQVGPKLSDYDDIQVILCPSFVALFPVKQAVERAGYHLKLGAQNVAMVESGAHTGEVSAKMIAPLADYVIVGHSERRKYYGETNADVVKKTELLLNSGITPLLCVNDLAQLDFYIQEGPVITRHAQDIIFVYEPAQAISGGGAYHPEIPADANNQAGQIKTKISQKARVIYGGSINPDNIAAFFSQEHISGGLIGQASLDPITFLRLLNAIR